MKTTSKSMLMAAGLVVATQAAAQVTFYEREGFAGRSFTTDSRVDDLARPGFNDRASSVVVTSRRWEVCEDRGFGGRCVVLRPGRYDSLAAMGLDNQVSSVRDISRNARIADDRYAPEAVEAATPQITFYEREGFAGRSFTAMPAYRPIVRRTSPSTLQRSIRSRVSAAKVLRSSAPASPRSRRRLCCMRPARMLSCLCAKTKSSGTIAPRRMISACGAASGHPNPGSVSDPRHGH